MKNKLFQKLSIVMVFILFACMALGSGDSGQGSGKKEIVSDTKAESESVENAETAFSEEDEPEQKSGSVQAVTIDEQILLEQNDIKITAVGMEEDSIWGEGIKLLIENNSDRNIGVGCSALIVNDYMLSDLFFVSVAAGKKANDTMYLSSNQLEAAGISNVGQIEIYFHLYDSDSWETLFDSECAVIQTSAYDSMDSIAAVEGEELYNQDGVRIVGQYVDENSFWGMAVLLYIENTSGQNVGVSCDNMSINGFMVSPLFSSTVYDGKKAFDDITIFSSDLEENEIESVDEIELNFRVYDADSYDTINESGAVSFRVKD